MRSEEKQNNSLKRQKKKKTEKQIEKQSTRKWKILHFMLLLLNYRLVYH